MLRHYVEGCREMYTRPRMADVVIEGSCSELEQSSPGIFPVPDMVPAESQSQGCRRVGEGMCGKS